MGDMATFTIMIPVMVTVMVTVTATATTLFGMITIHVAEGAIIPAQDIDPIIEYLLSNLSCEQLATVAGALIKYFTIAHPYPPGYQITEGPFKFYSWFPHHG